MTIATLRAKDGQFVSRFLRCRWCGHFFRSARPEPPRCQHSPDYRCEPGTSTWERQPS